MLIALEIENFKGIATRQRIDFAPLTLLFGANSAGKSTILQALLYFHELVERGSADVDRTELGGEILELGGFARFVHRHDTTRAIVLRAEFTTPGGLERFGRGDLGSFFPNLDDDVASAWLELTIRFRMTPNFRGPIVERATIGVNGETEPLVWLEVGATLRDSEPLEVRINRKHPLFSCEVQELTDVWESISFRREAALEDFGEGTQSHDGGLPPIFALARGRMSALPAPTEPLRVIPAGDDSPDTIRTAEEVRTFLELVVLGTTAQLASLLRDALYIGPLRAIPTRGFLYERSGRLTSWADGLAAWELLLADRLTLVERTNAWLRKFGAGCQVVVQYLFDRDAAAEALSENHVNYMVRRLLLDTNAGSFVLPSEVGAGISQLIPVIVAAIEGRGGLTLIEQPEIHIHPALQVGLADLFIEAITRDHSRGLFLIETHSEHLILRLLRRIRETTESELAKGAPPFSEDKLSVIYVESPPGGVRVRQLRVDAQGEFVDRWPKGFFAERMQELL